MTATVSGLISSVEDDVLQCYNKGCGIKFKTNENPEGSCCFHSGTPIFHDAYKGWSCCNKKSTDFTTFLNTKGCTTGKHNPIKPEEPEKQRLSASLRDECIVINPKKLSSMERPNYSSQLERLKTVISQSLKDILNNDIDSETRISEDNDTSIKMGESCKNNGCKAIFEGEHSSLGICKYHPGFPVFHEGLKYWHCCQKRTTDFDVFLQQEGCTTGSHMWIKKNLKKATCRYDWHQTASFVVVTVYAKCSLPDFSYVDANPIRIHSLIAFGENQEFCLDYELGGIIVPAESSVTMAAAKVEIKLRKAEPKHWNKLFLPSKEHEKNDEPGRQENNSVADNIDCNLSVDAIDLSDI